MNVGLLVAHTSLRHTRIMFHRAVVLAHYLQQQGQQACIVTTGAHTMVRHVGSVMMIQADTRQRDPIVPQHPTLNWCVAVSQALWSGVQLAAEYLGELDLIDVPLWQAQGLATIQQFSGPTVVWHPKPRHELMQDLHVGAFQSEAALLDLEGYCLAHADGLLVGSTAAFDSLRNDSQILPPIIKLLSEHTYNSIDTATEASTREGLAQTLAFYHRVLTRSVSPNPSARRVYQVMEALDTGDAVSTITRRNARILADLGQPPEILTRWSPPALSHETAPINRVLYEPDCGLIFHYWNYNSSTWMIPAVYGRSALYYHNITPPEYFSPKSTAYTYTQRGYAQLAYILGRFDLLIGDSHYNLSTLRQWIRKPLPILVNYPIIELEVEQAHIYNEILERHLRSSGTTNILFVGRIARNKRQDCLIRVFDRFWREISSNVRLWLVGNDQSDPEYRAELARLCEQLPSGKHVVFTGKTSDTDMYAYYRAADLFMCASEHEGFCMPLIEAMVFDVPVLAYAATAIPETMGQSGVLFDQWDAHAITAAMYRILSDVNYRTDIINAQRRNLTRFSAGEAYHQLRTAVQFLTEGTATQPLEWIHPV